MGLDNVKLVYARWTHLPDPSFRLLGLMALTSMDDGRPPRYWGGREAMAFGLGRMVAPEPAPSDSSARAEAIRKARLADFQAVKRALAPIVKAGAVALLKPAGRDRNAEYGLYLEAAGGYASRTDWGTPDVPQGYASRTGQGYASRTPEEAPLRGAESRTEVGTNAETRSPQVTNSPGPVEIEYADAYLILQSFPDMGQSFLDQVGHLDSLKAQVIEAAQLARAKRNAS